MDEFDGEMVDDSHLNGDALQAATECAAAMMGERHAWLDLMDAHNSDLDRDNAQILSFCSFAFARHMLPTQRQQFRSILGVDQSKEPVTLDQFESGSAQFNRLVVSLVQLAYTTVASSSCTPGKQGLLEQANHLARLLQGRRTESLEDLVDLSSWRLLAGSYAASNVPRCLDSVKAHNTRDAQLLELTLFALDRQKLLKRHNK
jgi:hypothetical protein